MLSVVGCLFLTRSEMMSVVEYLLMVWWVLFLTRSEMLSVVGCYS